MELEAAKMIGAGLAAIALAGAGVGIGIIFLRVLITIPLARYGFHISTVGSLRKSGGFCCQKSGP